MKWFLNLLRSSVDSGDSKLASFEIPSDFDAAIEHLQTVKSHVEARAKDLNIEFNFNGSKIKD